MVIMCGCCVVFTVLKLIFFLVLKNQENEKEKKMKIVECGESMIMMMKKMQALQVCFVCVCVIMRIKFSIEIFFSFFIDNLIDWSWFFFWNEIESNQLIQ